MVADGDTDGSWRLAEEYGTRVVRISTPGGPARARNLGAEQAEGDILFFVDADVTVPQDAVSQVIRAFQEAPELSAIFGSYDDTPFETNFLSQYKNRPPFGPLAGRFGATCFLRWGGLTGFTAGPLSKT